MDSPSSHVAKATKHEPRDPKRRLYRKIGIAAVAAALDLASGPAEANVGEPAMPQALEVRAA